jgi:hypothetical protein
VAERGNRLIGLALTAMVALSRALR